MQLGAVFPQTEVGADPVVIRDYAQAVEGLGYHHLVAYEHVIGAHPDRLTTRLADVHAPGPVPRAAGTLLPTWRRSPCGSNS